jgi:uncharacterized protein (TIGR03437 family)
MLLLRGALLACVSTACAWAQAPVVLEGTWDGAPVLYQAVDGWAVVGDQILGSIESTKPGAARAASFTTGSLWPDGVIPYEIDPAIPAATATRVQQAIDAWNGYGTPIRLQPRAGETAYTRFIRKTTPPAGACFSNIGRSGGMQTIQVEDGCSLTTLIHEIGHTVGFRHEHVRTDRNSHVTVLWENVSKTLASNFTQTTSGDVAGYEYASNMHYGPFTFSAAGEQVLDTVPPGIPMGEAPGFNPADLDAVKRKYGVIPESVTVTTNPPGLTVLVDGVAAVGPSVFPWTPGSTHTIEVPANEQTLTSRRYRFARWSNEQERSHSITVSNAVTVYTANFVRRIPLTVSAQAGGSAEVTPASPDGHYAFLTRVTLRAIPQAGFRFYRWIAGSGGSCPIRGASSNPAITPPLQSPASCVAQFTTNAVTTITSDPPGQTVRVDGGTFTGPTNFQFAAGSTHTVSATSPTAGSTVRYQFDGWSDGIASDHTITASAQGGVLTARFTTQYLLTISQSTGGTILPTPFSTEGFYDSGTLVTLQAQPLAGRLLSSWTGDLMGRQNPATVLMDRERLVAATFSTSVPSFVVVNSLSFIGGGVAPGELVSVFGEGLGQPGGIGGVLDSNGRVATELAGTRILFDGVPGPILYASDTLVNVVVPYGVAGKGIVGITPEYLGQKKPTLSYLVSPTAPGVVANPPDKVVVINEDGTLNRPDHPAARGSVVIFWATGEGLTTPAGVDGRVAVPPLAKPQLPVSVRIGGKVAEVQYAGNAPGFVAGAMQVNVRVPEDAPTGNVSLYFVVGETVSQTGVTISVE